MEEIKHKSLQSFLDELASRRPTPGGGSVAALMGAQAAALIAMVCNLTIGKPKYAEVDVEMRQLLAEAETLRETLTQMIKADVDVFDRLMACYALPKASDDEKAYRAGQIQAVLKDATDVPLACAKACFQAIALSRVAAEKGSLAVVSDAGVAVMAAYAGLKSAALNVHINAVGLKDREFAETRLAELEQLMHGVDTEVEAIYHLVQQKL